MDKDRFKDFDEEERQLVLDFERTVLRGGMQFFDVDELEVIIDYYLEVGDMEPLERAVEYAEQLYPDSTTVRLRRAHLLIAKEQYEPARRIVDALRRREPKNTDEAYSLGVVNGAMGEHEAAVKYYLEAAEDGWQLGRIYANIAEEYYMLHELDEAIRYYKLALDTDSYDNATLYNYVDTAIQMHCLDDTAAYLQSFVGEHPYSSVGWHCLGNVYREQGQLEKAVDAYEYALAIDKNDVAVYYDLAATQEYAGNPGEAVTTLLRARDIGGNRNEVYRQVASVYARADNGEMAIMYLRKALEENPDDAVTLSSLALAYAFVDEKSLAMPLLKKSLRLAPENAEVLNAAAIIYENLGNYEAAGDYYDRMIAADGCTESMCQRYVMFLYKQKLYDLLIDFGLESLELYPEHPFYSTFLAAAYFYTNRYNRASGMLPFVDPVLLAEICPEIIKHPRLGPLVPPVEDA